MLSFGPRVAIGSIRGLDGSLAPQVQELLAVRHGLVIIACPGARLRGVRHSPNDVPTNRSSMPGSVTERGEEDPPGDSNAAPQCAGNVRRCASSFRMLIVAPAGVTQRYRRVSIRVRREAEFTTQRRAVEQRARAASINVFHDMHHRHQNRINLSRGLGAAVF